MAEFILYGLGIVVVVRLMFMFARESVPAGKPITLDGDVVHVYVGRGKHKSVDALAVGFEAPRGWRFNLRREGPFDRFAKWIGMAQEFQTNDIPFDGRIYIECDDVMLHRQLSARRPLRNELFSLFGLSSIKSLACVDGRLWFTLATAGWDKQLSDERIGRDAATELHAPVRVLREQMASPVVSDDSARDPTRVTRRHFAVVMLVLAVVGGIGLFWKSFHQDHQVVLDNIPKLAAWTTITIGCALLLAMFTTLGGTARAQRVFLDILIAGIPAAWLTAFCGTMYFNESLDLSVVRRVPVPIGQAWVESDRKHTHYYLAVAHWPAARGKPVVPIKSSEYQIMQSRNCVDVLWHSGRFGDGWIEGYQPHDSTSCDEGVER